MENPVELEALAAEVANGNFTDERLTNRLRMVIAGVGKDPSVSLPKSLDSAELEALYRFLSNVHVAPDEILASHVEATRCRCEEQETFLLLHDATHFQYRAGGERRGLGHIKSTGPGAKQGFFAHVSLAVCADGTRCPLGVAAVKTWVRGSSKSELERARWEEQVRLSSERLDAKSKAIHVMDREAESYQMFHSLMQDGHRFIVRCRSNRYLDTPPEDMKLGTLFESIPSSVTREVPLTRRKKKNDARSNKTHPPRDARIATLSISAATVSLKRPSTESSRHLEMPSSLEINVIRVWEQNPPDGEPGVEWFLYTTEPIATQEQQLAVVDYYRARWIIEEYFKALKTGCAFEKKQLQDYEALINLLATLAPIAYRLLLLRSEARRAPNEKATRVLSPDELDVLRACGRAKLSADPTVREVYIAVARLGGYIKYSKNDPGWLTLARGYEELETLTRGWVAAKLQRASDQR